MKNYLIGSDQYLCLLQLSTVRGISASVDFPAMDVNEVMTRWRDLSGGAESFGIIQAWFQILFALMAIYCIFNIPQCTAELYGAAESIFI